MREIEISLFRPHEGQQKIINGARRFNTIPCARRFGKTELISNVHGALILPALQGKFVAIFAPKFKDVEELWNSIIDTYRTVKENGLIERKDETKKIIRFLGGGRIDFWSLHNEGEKENGRGRKYHRVIYEETQKIPDNVLKHNWEKVARVCLSDFKGDAYFIGTSNGRFNYWYELCRRGAVNGQCTINHFGDLDIEPKQGNNKDWCTFRMITGNNPMIDQEEIESASLDLDQLSYLQEYYSVFVDYSGNPWVYVLKDKELQNKVFTKSKPIKWQSEQLYISFDFNKIPMTAAVMKKVMLTQKQMVESKFKYGVHIVKEFKIGSVEDGEASIYDTCAAVRDWVFFETGKKIGAWYENGEIKHRFPCTLPFLVTGDASGNRSDGRQKVPITYYEIIQDELQIANDNFVIPKANPLHAESYVQTNTIISRCPNFEIYEDLCPSLKLDTLRIKSDNSRGILKGKGEEKQADLLDNLRYLLNTFCQDIRVT